MDAPTNKSSPSDPIQSLVQQLTSMANTQHKLSSTKPENVISPWGQTGGPSNLINNSAQPQQQPPQVAQPNQWGSPWEYREQMAKLVSRRLSH